MPIDIYPTLTDLAGIALPSGLAGASLRPLLDNPAAKWDRPAFTQVQRKNFPGRSVRTERWRYTEWDHGRQGVRRFYDHDNDRGAEPGQDCQDRASVVAELRGLLHKTFADEPRGAAK